MIEIKNCSKRYGKHIIFNNFSLKINDNSITAIVGDSGKGKTTLLNMIGLLDQDYEGNIIINKQNISKLKGNKKLKFIRDNLSYLFQNYALIENKTVKDNLLIALEYEKIPKKQKDIIINKALKDVGLSNYQDTLVFTLSGGEQQRVGLARTMLKKGAIILADEPTGNLDYKNKEIVFNILKKLRDLKKTVIIVTHDLELANMCDNVVKI